MKEFVEKLFDRLDKSDKKELFKYRNEGATYLIPVSEVKKVVNQLVEEYKSINFTTDFLQYVNDNEDNPDYDNDNGWSLADLIDLSIKFSNSREHAHCTDGIRIDYPTNDCEKGE